MVTEIRIYIEGGGDSRSTKDELRGGYRVFLRDIYDLASTKRIRCRIVMCGGRNSAFEDFKTAIQSHPQAFNVLLVDAEAPVVLGPWAHLQQGDGWISSFPSGQPLSSYGSIAGGLVSCRQRSP